MIYILLVLLGAGFYGAATNRLVLTQMDLSQLATLTIDGLTTYDRLTPAHVVALCAFSLLAFAIGQKTLAFLAYGVVAVILSIAGLSATMALIDNMPPAAAIDSYVHEFVYRLPNVLAPAKTVTPAMKPAAATAIQGGPDGNGGFLSTTITPVEIGLGALVIFAAVLARRRAILTLTYVLGALSLLGAGAITYNALYNKELPSVAHERMVRTCSADLVADKTNLSPQCLSFACDELKKGMWTSDFGIVPVSNPQTKVSTFPYHRITALCSAQHT